jgi:hypothetical protein
MYDDISHTDLEDLKTRKKTVYVLSFQHVESESESGRNEQPMHACIELFRSLYVQDMSVRCGLYESVGVRSERLPSEIAMACILNPIYGGK